MISMIRVLMINTRPVEFWAGLLAALMGLALLLSGGLPGGPYWGALQVMLGEQGHYILGGSCTAFGSTQLVGLAVAPRTPLFSIALRLLGSVALAGLWGLMAFYTFMLTAAIQSDVMFGLLTIQELWIVGCLAAQGVLHVGHRYNRI